MKVTLKQAFSILDGRLSTNMEDVSSMLSYVVGMDLFTHELPSAMKALKDANPKWFQEGIHILDVIRTVNDTNDFTQLMQIIDEQYDLCVIKLEKIF